MDFIQKSAKLMLDFDHPEEIKKSLKKGPG
jgi:hypothetical protein